MERKMEKKDGKKSENGVETADKATKKMIEEKKVKKCFLRRIRQDFQD